MRTRLILIFLFCAGLLSGSACRETKPPAPQSAPRLETPASSGAPAASAPGFATQRKFEEHYEKHGREFGAIGREEYLRMAQELRDRPAGGKILEAVRADGVITRFDKESGAFLAFNPDRTIRTFFKPNDGLNYFWRQSKR